MKDWQPIAGLSQTGWIGYDFDGVLAHYENWNDGKLGPPIKGMVDRAKKHIADGEDVRIFTARVGPTSDKEFLYQQHRALEDWSREHLGKVVPITCIKDMGMKVLYDDRAYRVVANKGHLCPGCSS